MGWCDDANIPKYYNKLIKIDKKIRCERLTGKITNMTYSY